MSSRVTSGLRPARPALPLDGWRETCATLHSWTQVVGKVCLPSAAYYNTELSEFVLPSEAVRTAASPADELASFLESTYAAAANLAGWNRFELERR